MTSSDISKPRQIDRTRKAEDCETCAGTPPGQEVVNHSMMWNDGDIICSAPGCGRYIRMFDAG